MFERESIEYADNYYCTNSVKGVLANTWQKGAEFGYNRANEWHYPSKGEYPKEYEDILICFLTEEGMKDLVRGWREYDSENDRHIFKYLNVLGTQYLETVIAWKEIVLPEEG